jgi:hypothetical protein
MLRDFDAALEISADQIGFRDYRYDEPAMTINLNNGVLTVPHFRSGMFDGTAALEVRLDATTDIPAITIGLDLRDADMARLLPAVAGRPVATGKMSLAGQFTGSGRSQYEIVSSLAGQAQLLARDGIIQKLNLAGLAAVLKGQINPLQLAGQLDRAARGGRTPYKQIEAPIIVSDGVVRIPPTQTMTGAGDLLQAGGTIDLPAWTIALAGEFRLAEFQSFPPVPFSVTGPVDDSSIKYRWGQFVGQAVKDLGANMLQGALGSDGGQNAIEDLTGGQAPLSLLGRKKPAAEESTDEQAAPSQLIGSQRGEDEPAGEQTPALQIEEVAKGVISLLGGKKDKEAEPEDDGGN